jgi:hypothetical protein
MLPASDITEIIDNGVIFNITGRLQPEWEAYFEPRRPLVEAIYSRCFHHV